MAQQIHARAGVDPRQRVAPSVPRPRSGWLTFAAVMFFIAAAVNVLYGITALVNDDYFAADELLWADLSAWGAILLGFAALQAGIGVLILRNNAVGVVGGSLLALLHAVAVMVSIGAYPVWSVVMLVIDALIIYGLVVHGVDERS